MLATVLLLFLLAGAISASSVARNPIQLLGVVEGPRIHTQTHRVNAFSHFDLSLDLYNGLRKVRLTLEPNHDILAEDATISYLAPDGSIHRQEPIQRLDHKVFKGTARMMTLMGDWETVGWARISIIRDGVHPLFEGALSVGLDHHHIQMSSNYMRNKHDKDPLLELESDEYMVVWRDSDIAPTDSTAAHERRAELAPQTCAADGLHFNTRPDHPVYQNIMRRHDRHWGTMPVGRLFGKRQIDSQPGSGNSAGVNLVSTIGRTDGCPTTRKVALVGVATDCTYTGTFNSTEAARQNIITQMNAASSLYESSFNISLGLQNLTVSDASCPGTPPQATPWNQNCDTGADIQARLNLFSGWRGTLGDQNSHWTLLTNCNSGPAVGLAWLGQACIHQAQTSNSSGVSETVSGANVIAKTPTEWQVIAHETGHTFGAVHDCTSQTCANSNTVNAQQCCPLSASTCDAGEQFIMNPFSAQGITHFSACSIGNICSGIGRNSINTTCLSANRGVVTISGQQCGNGIVEEGEDCDCGGPSGCGNNPCCDPNTCKFKNNAVCDDSNEDCCRNCQFAPSTQVCRPSAGTCDPAEMCTGNTPTCPTDTTAPDGQSCTLPNNLTSNAGNLACASGQCTSRNLQCQTVMGVYTHGNNDTYACDSSTCTLSCASPSFGPGMCYGLQQNLLDGTPCGGGGKCQNGQCLGSSTGKEIKNWIDSHKGLVIGIASALGGLILLAILSCIVGSFRRRRRGPLPPKTVGSSPNGSWFGQYGPYGPPPPVPPHRTPVSNQQGPAMGESDWIPPSVPFRQQNLYGNGIIGNSGGWNRSQDRLRQNNMGLSPPVPPPQSFRYA